jgi:hypothetical protein
MNTKIFFDCYLVYYFFKEFIMKNFMKLLLVPLFLGASLSAAQKPVDYRIATEDDADALMEIYAQFNEEDAHNLLLFPIEMRRDDLVKNLIKRRIYVATVSEGQREKIVSFAKVYFMTVEADRIDTMRG